MWYSLIRSVSVPRIFIRPRMVLFLSLITLFFLLVNWSKDPDMLKAHVTLKGVKRVVRFPKGETVQELRYGILRDFSDLLIDTVPPACVEIQSHDITVGDDVDLPIDLKLEEDIKVKAKFPTTQDETALCGFKMPSVSVSWRKSWMLHYWLTLGDQSNGVANSPIQFHRINTNTSYRLWSPVFGGSLLQRGDKNVVKCGGAFTDKNYGTLLLSHNTGGHEFAFIFKENAGRDAKKYVLNAKSKNLLVATWRLTGFKDTCNKNPLLFVSAEAEIVFISLCHPSFPKLELDLENPIPSSLDDTMKFIPDYYWSFTLFKNVHYKTLYLGCGSKGNSFLVPMNTTQYPDPRALFITNKYVVDLGT